MKGPMPDNDGTMCHETGYKKSCFKCVSDYKCQKWDSIPVEGERPGETRLEYGCTDRLNLKVLMNVGMQLGQAAASFDSMRNNIARSAEATAVMITGLREQRAPNSNGHDIIPDAIDVTPPLPQIEE